MKSDAITVVVFSRIQREQQLDSREYGSYTSENSHIFRECLVGQISHKFLERKMCRHILDLSAISLCSIAPRG